MNSLDEYLASITPEDPAVEDPSLLDAGELVVEKRTGEIRQAGADATGAEIVKFRAQAERSLFVFMRGVLGRNDLTIGLHKPLCDGLQKIPPRRKLRLYPRHHRKTSIVSHGLPLHMVIQPAATNAYFPGMSGLDTRILLSGETEDLVTKNIRVVRGAAESNKIFRGLWPHVVWDKPAEPRSVGKAWNDAELTFRRETEFPEATITGRGVGGAITGLHPNVLIKDDLISFEARNSDATMETAIEWHKASRGLIEGNPHALEFIIGTRWKKFDLYSFIIDNDSTVDVEVRSMVEENQIIYPEIFTWDDYDRLKSNRDGGYGPELFSLLMMNIATGTGLTDFDMDDVRSFTIRGRQIVIDEDERDIVLRARVDGSAARAAAAALPKEEPSWFGEDPIGRDAYLRLSRA